jgi:uncharacterized repeat protein (TIGR02543 family)
MKKRFLSALFAVLLLLPILTLSVNAYAPEEISEPAFEGYIIKLTDGAELPDFADSGTLEPIPYAEGMYVTLDPLDVLPILAEGTLEYFVRDQLLEAFDTSYEGPSGQDVPDQWYQSFIEAEALWNAGLNGSGAKVAVIDSGIYAAHEDFSAGKISGQSFLTDSNGDLTGDVYSADATGHGTFVSGIIGAVRGNSKGINGIADGAELLAARCFPSGPVRTSDVISAIYYAINADADVINMSFGGSATESLYVALSTPINSALEKGIILVAAVGNDGNANLQYPAGLDGVIGVGAVDRTGEVALSSTRNRSVYVTAPGSNMPGVSNAGANRYTTGSGTSYAAPVVSALAAIARQVDPAIDGEDFMALLKESAVDRGDAGYDYLYGYGIVSGSGLYNALHRDIAITYVLNDGELADNALASFTIDRVGDATLPIPTRSGYVFAGWYDNVLLDGSPLTVVPRGTVAGVTYYAKWYDTAQAEVEAITVLGVPAEKTDSGFTVLLPLGTVVANLQSTDISITPRYSDAAVTTPVSADNGVTWTFSVTKGASANHTLTVELELYGTPVAGATVIGAATPASLDGVTVAQLFSTNLSTAFIGTTALTSYEIASSNGGGAAAIAPDGKTLTYTPSYADAGKSVSIAVRARTGNFASTNDLAVSVTVGALPPSNSVSGASIDTFDKNLGTEDLELYYYAYGNNLTGISCDGAPLTEGTQYTFGSGDLLGANIVLLKAAYLKTLSTGAHTVTFTFDDGRTSNTSSVNLTVTATTYTVTFNGNGGTPATTTRVVIPGGKVDPLPTVTRTDYHLTGWKTGVSSGTVFNASTAVTGSITVYAQWEADSSGGGGGSFGGGPGGGSPPTEKESEKPAEELEEEETPPEEAPVTPPGAVLALFTDVKSGEWFYDDVAFAVAEGLFRGTDVNTFSPNGAMTRAMLITVLARLDGQDTDGGSTWYSKSLSWGVSHGITDGSNPDNNITREQLVTILYRYAGSPDAGGGAADSRFRDAGAVADYAKAAFAWAVSLGIINGDDRGNLNPQGNATRAEVAAMLHRFIENVQ